MLKQSCQGGSAEDGALWTLRSGIPWPGWKQSGNAAWWKEVHRRPRQHYHQYFLHHSSSSSSSFVTVQAAHARSISLYFKTMPVLSKNRCKATPTCVLLLQAGLRVQVHAIRFHRSGTLDTCCLWDIWYLIFLILWFYIFTATRKNLFMTKEVSEVQQLDYPVTRKLETGETG